MAEWHTVASARDQWVDAPTDDGEDEDASLTELLEAAKAAVLAYAPSLGELTIVDGVITYGQPVVDEDGYIVNGTLESIPTTYRIAQLREARNQWNDSRQRSGYMDNNGEIQSMFLPWHGIVRPKQGKPVIV
jgi:hypothetical protein